VAWVLARPHRWCGCRCCALEPRRALGGLSIDVDQPVERGAVVHDDRARREHAGDIRRRHELDPFGGGDVPRQRPMNRDPPALDIGVHVALRRDEEGTLLHSDLALHTAMDRDVLPAVDFTGDEKRRSNGSHRINRPEEGVVPVWLKDCGASTAAWRHPEFRRLAACSAGQSEHKKC